MAARPPLSLSLSLSCSRARVYVVFTSLRGAASTWFLPPKRKFSESTRLGVWRVNPPSARSTVPLSAWRPRPRRTRRTRRAHRPQPPTAPRISSCQACLRDPTPRPAQVVHRDRRDSEASVAHDHANRTPSLHASSAECRTRRPVVDGDVLARGHDELVARRQASRRRRVLGAGAREALRADRAALQGAPRLPAHLSEQATT